MRDLLEALTNVDPEDDAAYCHFCRITVPDFHEEGCPWVEARCYLEKTEEYRDLRVGNTIEELREEEEPEEDGRVTSPRLQRWLAREAGSISGVEIDIDD